MKKNSEKEIVFRKVSDIIGGACHGAKIQRGSHIEKVIAARIRAKFPNAEVLEQVALDASVFAKSQKHKVDIVKIDHEVKTVLIISSKSAAISNTDPKDNIGLPQMRQANESAKLRWPGYSVESIVLRTSGEKIQEWENAGFHTFKTDTWLGDGADVLAEVDKIVCADIAANIRKNIKKSGVTDEEQIAKMLALVPLLNEALVK